MIITNTAIENNRVVVLSEYQTTRLVRKNEKTTYYIARCLCNRADPTIVDSICFIKQTEEVEVYTKRRQNMKNCIRKMYENEIKIHKYIEREVNSASKYFSTLYDYWHESDKIRGRQQGKIHHKYTIVTKYEEYGDLYQFTEFIRQQKMQLTEKDVLYILNNILRASLELYKVRIIHRDIKPQNIFIDQFFQFKFGDFGISILGEDGQHPQSTEKVGTYGFMSPEYFQPTPYSYEVDVWAIGCVLYYLIYQVLPYGSEKTNYATKVKGRLKGIENQNKHSQNFNLRMKNFLKRFFVPRDQRQPSIVLYEYEYMHEFRITQLIQQFKEKYVTYITQVNESHASIEEKYILQRSSVYHEKVLEVVHYENWGYFFLLSNCKIIGLFNSPANEKIIRTYPDCLQADLYSLGRKQLINQEEVYHNILKHIKIEHFDTIIDYLKLKHKVFSKKYDCTIANIIQYKNSLFIKLKSEFEHMKKIELQQKEMFVQRDTNELYLQFEGIHKNENRLNLNNNTIQLFFFPQEKTGVRRQLKYTCYKSSLTLNNCMLEKVVRREAIMERGAMRNDSLGMKKLDKSKGFKSTNTSDSILYKTEQSRLSSFQNSKLQSEIPSSQLESGFTSKLDSKQETQEPSKSTSKIISESKSIQRNEERRETKTKSKSKLKNNEKSKGKNKLKEEERIKRRNRKKLHEKRQENVKMKQIRQGFRSFIKLPAREEKRSVHRLDARERQQRRRQLDPATYRWMSARPSEQTSISQIVPLKYQIFINEIQESKSDRYKMFKYHNPESLYASNRNPHINMFSFSKQVLSSDLRRQREEGNNQSFLHDYFINQT